MLHWSKWSVLNMILVLVHFHFHRDSALLFFLLSRMMFIEKQTIFLLAITVLNNFRLLTLCMIKYFQFSSRHKNSVISLALFHLIFEILLFTCSKCSFDFSRMLSSHRKTKIFFLFWSVLLSYVSSFQTLCHISNNFTISYTQ